MRKVDESREAKDNSNHMADIIDLSLVAASRKFLETLIDTRGVSYFLRKDARRPFELEPERVDLVVRTAAKSRDERHGRVPPKAYEHARTMVRRELIRRVVAEMIGVGL
jgi:hypothetical protein